MPCIEITRIIDLGRIATSIYCLCVCVCDLIFFGSQIHFTTMIVDEFSGYNLLEEYTMTWFLGSFHLVDLTKWLSKMGSTIRHCTLRSPTGKVCVDLPR